MKKIGTLVFFLIFVLHSFGILQAQNVKLGVELGCDAYFGDAKKPELVRENRSSSRYYGDYDYYDYYSGIIGSRQTMSILYLGLKSEFFCWHNQLGFSTGLRFSNYLTTLGSDRDYFLWQVRQEGVNTDYVRIRDITQHNYYVGFPLEVRFFPKRRELPVQQYFKVGSVFNFLVQSKNNINFQNKAMNSYSTLVNDGIENSNNFNAYLYFAVGLKIGGFKVGERTFPYINIEAHFPGIMLTSNTSSFLILDGETSIGIQLSVQIPLGKNSPIGLK
jgi:hypothetical protein